MTEQELRVLVREAIARHLEGQGAVTGPAAVSSFVPVASVHAHLSHAKFSLPALGESCIIEPAVACNHCGFCKSYGH
jgi:predicted Zn-ribbon and HTH transcriptional regulator